MFSCNLCSLFCTSQGLVGYGKWGIGSLSIASKWHDAIRLGQCGIFGDVAYIELEAGAQCLAPNRTAVVWRNGTVCSNHSVRRASKLFCCPYIFPQYTSSMCCGGLFSIYTPPYIFDWSRLGTHWPLCSFFFLSFFLLSLVPLQLIKTWLSTSITINK